MIIHSLLETDFYKLTMWQSFFRNKTNIEAEYRFVCRNTPKFPLVDLKEEIEAEIAHLCSLEFKPEELRYLASLHLFQEDFLTYLSEFKFQREHLKIEETDGELSIKAVGNQLDVMGFEIFCLAITSELYFKRFNPAQLMQNSRERLSDKINVLKKSEIKPGFEFFDFGLRRRWSSAWQEEMVRTLKQEVPEYFKGTSNVYLAMKYNLKPIGTMAHEYMQSYQVLNHSGLKHFQGDALHNWLDIYQGDLAIALTDTISMDAFLNDFDAFLTNAYQGLRHDSGDPIQWGEKAIAHYKRLAVDTKTKQLVFSDGLTIDKAITLHNHFSERIKTGSGIGTSLSNDAGSADVDPLNLVMKLMSVNGKPVAKLSDSPGKTLCDDLGYVAHLKALFNYSMEAIK